MNIIKNGIITGLLNMGNESLYPMIENLKELGWDVMGNPANNTLHHEVLLDLEKAFITLYNSKISLKDNASNQIHNDLYESVKLLNIRSIDKDKIFEELIIRDDKWQMIGFSDRFKNLLQNSSQGLKKTLELYNDVYRIWKNHELESIVHVDHPLKEEIQSISEQFLKMPKNHGQVRQVFTDQIYRKILDNELHNEQQINSVANLILQNSKEQFIDNIASKVSGYCSNNQDCNKIMIHIYKLINNLDDDNNLKNSINELASLDIVKNNKELRAYIGKSLFVQTSYLDNSKILKTYDQDHNITDFKPELVSQAQEKIASQIFHNIKTNNSKKIYNNDCLIERYLPVSGRGIKNTEENLERVLNEHILPHLNNNNALDLILNKIIEEYRLKTPGNNLPLYEENKAEYQPFTNNFKEIFFKDDNSLHNLMINAQIIKNIGNSAYTTNILSKSNKEGAAELIKDIFNMGGGDRIYCIISKHANESIDLDQLLIKNEAGIVTNINKDHLFSIVKNKDAQDRLFVDLISNQVNKTYYDLEKETYKFRNIHTKQSLQRDSSIYSFDEDYRKERLFRNLIETRQHEINNNNHEEPHIQVGDSHYSNVSYSIIPDIAVDYTQNRPNNRFCWIKLSHAQKGVNVTEYMENNIHRKAAQEFVVPDLISSKQLGAVKIEKISESGKEATYRIVDGFVSQEVFGQIQKDKLTSIHGIDGKFKFFLEAAYKYHDQALTEKPINRANNEFEFTSILNATSIAADRTDFQHSMDGHYRKPSIKKEGTHYDEKDLELYHKAIREQKYYFDLEGCQDYYESLSKLQVQEKQNIKNYQKTSQQVFAEKQISLKSKEEIFFQTVVSPQEYLENILSRPQFLSTEVNKRAQKRLVFAVQKIYETNHNIDIFCEIITNSVNKNDINSNILKNFISQVEKLEGPQKLYDSLSNDTIKNIKKIRKNSLQIVKTHTDDEFLEKLITTFDFIDTTDIFTAMVDNNPNPWRRYQNPNSQKNDHLDQWYKMLEYDSGNNDLSQQFLQIQNHLALEPGIQTISHRTSPITAGGAYNKMGKRIPAGVPTWKSVCTQYWPITHGDLKILKENELITVLESHEIHNSSIQADYVCKYRYPDLRDYNGKLAKYTQELDADTKRDIQTVLNSDISIIAQKIGLNVKKGTKLKDLEPQAFTYLISGPKEFQELQDECHKPYKELVKINRELDSNPAYGQLLNEFGRLNKEVLQKSTEKILNDKTLTPFKRYQLLISLHPLEDMNGRCMRMIYQKESGKPMYMFNWDQDILVTEKQFNKEYQHFKLMVDALKQEYSNSKTQNTMPDYYKSPGLWVSAFGIDKNYYNKDQLKQMKNIIYNSMNSHEVREAIKQKDYYSYTSKIMDSIYSFPGFKIESQKDVDGNNALHIACRQKTNNIDKLLIRIDEEGLKLEHLKNNYGQTPIHVAACSLNFEAVTKFLKYSVLSKELKDGNDKNFYNNIMDNLSATSLQKFQSFIKFSSEVLTQEGYDIKLYKYDNVNTLVDKLLINSEITKCAKLITQIPDFPFDQKNIGKLLDEKPSNQELIKIKKIVQLSTVLSENNKNMLIARIDFTKRDKHVPLTPVKLLQKLGNIKEKIIRIL